MVLECCRSGVVSSDDSAGVRGLCWVSVAVTGVLVKVSGVLTSCGWVGDLFWVPFSKAGDLTQVPGVHLNGFFVKVSGV